MDAIGAYFLYDGDQVIADLDGTGALIASYTRTPGGKLLSCYRLAESGYDRGNYYIYTDALGSTVMAYCPDIDRHEYYNYEDFGTAGPENGDTRFSFTGAPYFSGSGLYQMGARYYNPTIGRFITRDSYRGNIYQPWTQNLYTYCNNNPINYSDPTGHYSIYEMAEDAADIGSSIGNGLNNFNDNYFGGPLGQIVSGDYTPIENVVDTVSEIDIITVNPDAGPDPWLTKVNQMGRDVQDEFYPAAGQTIVAVGGTALVAAGGVEVAGGYAIGGTAGFLTGTASLGNIVADIKSPPPCSTPAGYGYTVMSEQGMLPKF